MIETKKKQIIRWNFISRIITGIVIFAYMLYALVIELTGMAITTSNNMPSSTITEAFGGLEVIALFTVLVILGVVILMVSVSTIFRWIFTGVWKVEL